jgi:hypothetical protein
MNRAKSCYNARMHKRPTHRANPFLSPEGRLPSFAQRRLDLLLEKNREGELSRDEAQELKEIVEFVQDKTIEILGELKSRRKGRPVTKKRTGRRATA